MTSDIDGGALGVLLGDLVDDAGLFPPAELDMTDALRRHREDADRANPVLTGRFVCPATRLSELSATLWPDAHVRLCCIASPLTRGAVEAALTAAKADPRLELACLEGAITEDMPTPEDTAGVRTFVEIPTSDGWREALRSVRAVGHFVKIRCGGLRPELFPTPSELGALISVCADQGLSFKATAGLHHAVRHRDPATGFVHHGFLNLIAAAAHAACGRSLPEVVETLESEDSAALVAAATALSVEAATAARRLFVSYGSCSTSEPIEDLQALHLLSEETAA